MKKRDFLLILLLILNFSFLAQGDYFKENEDNSLNELFAPLESLKDKAIGSRYGELPRSSGFLVNDVVKGGSLFTKSLHRSGKVIFNSDAGEYLNKLKSLLLSDYPEIDKLVNIYITKNSTLNAFATVNNNVYVNVGLLARVQNEAQLAYILSHELMHIINAHIINQSLKINKKASKYDHNSVVLDGDIIQLYKHALSREHECEADMDGLKLFLKQDYEPSEVLSSLALLSLSSEYTFNPDLNKGLLLMKDDSTFNFWKIKTIDHFTFETDSNDTHEEVNDTSYRTHPAISQRIDLIEKAVSKEIDSSNLGVKYLVSEKDFTQIRKEANSYLNSMYASERDFMSLFLLSSYKLNFLEDISDDNINHLAYSVQGMLYDKFSGYNDGEYLSSSRVDSLIHTFYADSESFEFSAWCLSVLKQLKSKSSYSQISAYQEAISSTIFEELDKDSLVGQFGIQKSDINIDFLGLDTSKMSLRDISFNISPSVDMTKHSVRTFNDHQGNFQLNGGKTAIVNMNNIIVYKEKTLYPYLTYEYKTDEVKMEGLDLKTNKVWQNLEEDFPNKIGSYIPTHKKYSTNKYEVYSALNSWMQEKMYFYNYKYVSLNESSFNKLMNENDIQYAFSSLNIEIKAFSMGKFITTYFAPFIMPHYMPQLIANVVFGSSRKYQLSLIFDVKSGDLSFWDKRTHLEPNSIGQFQSSYEDVFKLFYK